MFIEPNRLRNPLKYKGEDTCTTVDTRLSLTVVDISRYTSPMIPASTRLTAHSTAVKSTNIMLDKRKYTLILAGQDKKHQKLIYQVKANIIRKQKSSDIKDPGEPG